MSYIGNTATTTNFTQGTDYFNGDGSTVAFTLSRPVVSVNDIGVFVNNVPQDPSSAYTVSGSTITFTGTPSSGTNNIIVRYLTTIQLTNVPAAGSVGKSQLDVIAGGTGAALLPIGTTAQRPSSPVVGMLRYNTTIDAYENYILNGGWTRVATPIPLITAISGTIYAGITTTLSITGSNFETQPGIVTFTSGAVVKTVSVTPSSDTSLSVAVPSEIYSVVAASDTVTIKYTNADNGVSAGFNKTVAGLPTGGTISTSGGYRYHAFTSSGTFSTVGFAGSTNYMLVAGGGGGGGGNGGGGGGAGGYITGTVTLSASNSVSVTIGGGGAAGTNTGNNASDGGTTGTDSSISGSITATASGGGGGGGSANTGSYQAPKSGGSGGGATGNTSLTPNAGASGTVGQGNNGGSGFHYGGYHISGGGGGGAGAAGGAGSQTTTGIGGNGGAGSQWLNGTYYAGGGGGGLHSTGTVAGTGGTGGGGNGASFGNANGSAGGTNTGGGGGGGGNASSSGVPNAGGSGIFIIRYATT
jgi:hypothetical protein